MGFVNKIEGDDSDGGAGDDGEKHYDPAPNRDSFSMLLFPVNYTQIVPWQP